jgi:hypothetical protein
MMHLKKLTVVLFTTLLSGNLYAINEPEFIDEICTETYYNCTDECEKLSNVSQEVVYQCIYSCEDHYEKCIDKEFRKQKED